MITVSNEWKKMGFTLKSSLKSRALTSVAAILWHNHEAQNFFIDTSTIAYVEEDEDDIVDRCELQKKIDNDYSFDWMKLQRKVEAFVQQLPIPESLKTDLSRFVDAAGNEILHWFRFNAHSFRMKKIPYKLLWTPVGTIDIRKTANTLVCDETLDTFDRFTLACYYCLEEHILTLLDQLDQDHMKMLYQLELDNESQNLVFPSLPVDFNVQSMVLYWRSYAKEKQPLKYNWESHSWSYLDGFAYSVNAGNEVGCKYFIPHVIKKDIDYNYLLEALVTTFRLLNFFTVNSKHAPCFSAPHRQLTHNLMLVMNNITDGMQLFLLKNYAKVILVLFLEWSWQDYFIKLYQHIGQYLTEDDSCYLFERILHKRKTDCKDYDYQKLFIELWLQTSSNHKQHIYSVHSKITSYLSSLFVLKDWGTFNLILKDATARQREELLLCPEILEACKTSILENGLNSIQPFINNCLQSKEELLEFRCKMKSLVNTSNEELSEFNNFFDVPTSSVKNLSINEP